MTKIASLPTLAAALLVCGLSTAPAAALANRTFVSGMGADSGSCGLTAPCRTFAFALSQTGAGGEIDVLDPADYGPVNITKSISIINDGAGVAAIGSSAENAITINAGASDSIHLRGLTIIGLGGLSSGIRFISGGYLAIENCVIRNFLNSGINISPTTSSSFSVSDTIVSNFGKFGIRIHPAGTAVVTGVLSKVTANNNAFSGIGVDGVETTGASLTVTIANSEACNNGNTGVLVTSESGHAAITVTLRNSIISNNISFGLISGANSVLQLAHSVVTGNGVGVGAPAGGIIQSTGDNDIDGNIFNNSSSLTRVALH